MNGPRPPRWAPEPHATRAQSQGGTKMMTSVARRGPITIKSRNFTDLMSAFPSSRRANSWLYFKRVFQALPDKAGGSAVMTNVRASLDHPHQPDPGRQMARRQIWL